MEPLSQKCPCPFLLCEQKAVLLSMRESILAELKPADFVRVKIRHFQRGMVE